MRLFSFVAFGLFLLLTISVPKASANCYWIQETYHTCNPNQFYCSEYTESRCWQGGCNGPYCATGWGYCCNRSYESDNVWGDPDSDPDCQGGECGAIVFPNDLVVDQQFHAKADARSSSEFPQPAYYTPSKCVGVYGIVEPAETYQRKVGM